VPNQAGARDPGFELAELVGGADEQHSHRADPSTHVIWRRHLDEGRAHEDR